MPGELTQSSPEEIAAANQVAESLGKLQDDLNALLEAIEQAVERNFADILPLLGSLGGLGGEIAYGVSEIVDCFADHVSVV